MSPSEHLDDWEVSRFAELMKVLEGFNGTTTDGSMTGMRSQLEEATRKKQGCSLRSQQGPGNRFGGTWHQQKRPASHMKNCRREFHIASDIFFAMRKERPTTTHSYIANSLLNYGLRSSKLTELKWTMPEYTTDLLSCWTRRGGSKNQKKWGILIPPCIWWTIW
ncbi:hypothetical protein H5410_037093 [Solanum commersonii]|uniref:Uncharacterized protein n=1 Tax=Solanum commersonii TaxID=4109 RepID=A0A9J5Y6S8_SOLCO|nr:hypothetical protein H5410_037093 [Solanum commersonii]